MIHQLRLYAFTAKDAGSIPGQGTKIPQAVWCGEEKKRFKHTKFETIIQYLVRTPFQHRDRG